MQCRQLTCVKHCHGLHHITPKRDTEIVKHHRSVTLSRRSCSRDCFRCVATDSTPHTAVHALTSIQTSRPCCTSIATLFMSTVTHPCPLTHQHTCTHTHTHTHTHTLDMGCTVQCAESAETSAGVWGGNLIGIRVAKCQRAPVQVCSWTSCGCGSLVQDYANRTVWP